jgi:hypothetical protein
MGLVYNFPCESGKEGRMHIEINKGKFFPWFEILGGEGNNANKLSLSFQIFLSLDFTWFEILGSLLVRIRSST